MILGVRPKRAGRGFLLGAAVLLGQLAADRTMTAAGEPPSLPRAGVPVRFTLERPAYATLVIDDAAGNRVRTLVSSVRLPSGENTAWWDGCDEGHRDPSGSLVRRRVDPGTYHVRGLVHDGIVLRYELTVNNPGVPPWKTLDRSGGWLADHTPPADILELPLGARAPQGKTAGARLLVCSSSGEAGDEFVWLDGEGRRIYGFNTGFWGGMFLARDDGRGGIADHQAYVFISGERDPDNDTVEVRAFRRSVEGEQDVERVVKITFPHQSRRFKTIAQGYGTNGLAVRDGIVVFSFTQFQKLVVADARKQAVIGELMLQEPRGLDFDADGRLLVISGKQVKRFAFLVQGGGPRLEEQVTLVASGLDDPRRIEVGPDRNLYVSDWGSSHQIKVFTPEGKFLQKIGTPGGPQLGLYDERRMSYPAGLAFDGHRRLWVAEAVTFPKRLSVWDPAAATFLRALYGPPKYGGGGAIDPRDRTRFYYAEYDKGGGIEYALDWDRGTSRPRAVYWRPEQFPDPLPGPAPECAFYAGGHQYLTNCFNGQLRYNQDRGTTIWRMDSDHVARSVAVIGNAGDMNHHLWGWNWKHRDAINALWNGRDPARILFVWSDANGDQVAQPEEIQWVESTRQPMPGDSIGNIGLMPLVHDDLSVTTSYGTRLGAPAINAQGVPVYDLKSITTVGDTAVLRSPLVAGGWALSDLDGEGGVDALVGADLKGAKRWRINSIPQQVIPSEGQLAALTRPLGPPVQPRTGEAGPLIGFSGEMGQVFLVTIDGLPIQDLGGDARVKPYWRMPQARRGMIVEGISFQQEHFHPSLGQLADGTIVLVAGFEHSSLLRLEGLESVRRHDFSRLDLDDAALQSLPDHVSEPVRKESRQHLAIALKDSTGAPRVDGQLDDWPGTTAWAPIGDRASASVCVAGDRLYAAFRTGEPGLLETAAGGDVRYQFKHGGALDLMIGSDRGIERRGNVPAPGDTRLLVTRVEGRPRAVLYRPLAAGAPASEQVVYQSPIGKQSFDQVLDVSDAIALGGRGGDYEFSIPLERIGLKPEKGREILGDLGILRGQGGQTVQRIYWNNFDTLLVSDLPSEARLQPGRWGVWRFE